MTPSLPATTLDSDMLDHLIQVLQQQNFTLSLIKTTANLQPYSNHGPELQDPLPSPALPREQTTTISP